MSAGAHSPPALVVLAAGASVRLGTSKALVELAPGAGGRAIELLLAAGAALGDPRPLVIAGVDHAALAALLPPEVELVHHPGWAAGRTGTVQLAAVVRPGRDLCLAPVDVPLVPAEVFAALGAAWSARGAPPRGWLAPRVEAGGTGRLGHPVVAGRELLARLKTLPASAPLSELRASADPLWSVPVTSEAVLDDLDTPADLARLRQRSGRR